MIIKAKLVKLLIKLYTEYKNIHVLSVQEFINEINEKKETSISKSEINYFLELTKHGLFIEKLTTDFIKNNSLSHINQIHVQVVIYMILFVLEDDNLDTLLQSFSRLNCFYLYALLETIVDRNQHLYLCQVACTLFEDEYVLDKIIYPLLNKIPTICRLAKKYEDLNVVAKKPNTKPKVFEILARHTRNIPPPPSNTPTYKYKFRAVPVPHSTYKTVNTEKKFNEIRKKNRRRAEELLKEASKVPERLTRVKEIIEYDVGKLTPIKLNPVPVFKDVQVKGNLTTTLREASRILKNKDNDIKKIEDLMQGGLNKEAIEQIEEELRKEKEVEELNTIEKNHLKGLLSYEEAILAKQKLLKTNKEKMVKFKEEKLKVVEALNRWREEEEQKIKSLVEKSQNIKVSAKESEEKMLERKREQVRIQQHETKEMLERAYEEKMKELSRKEEIIEEIKTLHRLRLNHIKEFDPTETANLGLLCEMSLMELQERLAITKMNMQEELEKKKEEILKRKDEHRLMIENIKNLISQNRSERKPKASRPPELERSPELIQLRKLLEEKRKLRNSWE